MKFCALTEDEVETLAGVPSSGTRIVGVRKAELAISNVQMVSTWNRNSFLW